ncbi:ABC transporter ATP-binding protein [Mycobacteroides franklinii]|uniref:ATP-binding cassette domain-containing protein n=1 Tax=Mycobacteroides franklinii TaxID=948102 RepID=A0A4R8R4B1_9MYCO|nr:ATP-binding cassette domain-containing protein [Mycobacteroides franklinii]ORA60590.1 export ABC transporter ATP-binding protein [Mycobacteroides franklinii]TDH22239.1 ATP-binding cassette domain-containing protein [Mycobacteroides franklinii]TDZ43846.1 putative ABC transporter ATP-binding protein YxlF [Mycobacteroides franklinii]TDZ50981.1 putative ABC transporter ATP-binding protein YxlF [Mycobacteroides franklinii]TDZ57401.1 putative ABC transporter ATP-binding protein YxlF [Mycobacteroi
MIELRSLTKVYGQTPAVDDLSVTVEPGVVTGFLGPNGAGKSTTLRMIVGLARPTSGTATIGGKQYHEIDHPLREVGALLDPKQFHPNRSARNHLRWIAAANDIPTQRVDEVLEMVGLTEVANRHAGTFSLGMSQRLGIAVALLGDPKVLLFDEPVNGLDPEGIHWIRTLMQSLAAQGRTVLVSSHLLSEMANTADQLVVIGRGRLIAATSMHEFVSRAGADVVRVRSPQIGTLRSAAEESGFSVAGAENTGEQDVLEISGALIEQVGELAARLGVTLYELSPQRVSLEDAYLSLTDDAVQYRSQLDDPPAGRVAGAVADQEGVR